MFTETELRDMLSETADQLTGVGAPADRPANIPTVAAADVIDLETVRSTGPRSRRGWALASGAAVAVAASVVAGSLVLAGTGSKGGHAAEPGGQGGVLAASTTVAPGSNAPALRDVDLLHVAPVAGQGTVNNFVAGARGTGASQVVTRDLGHGRQLSVTVAPAAAFDGASVARNHPVPIAGTTGHYATLRLFPLSDNGAGKSAPLHVVVFQSPGGDWGFAAIENTDNGADAVGHDSASAIVSAFAGLHASFAGGTYTSPIKLGYLPAGVTFRDAQRDTGVATPQGSVAVEDGSRSIDVTLRSVSSAGPLHDGTQHLPGLGTVTRIHRVLPGGLVLIVDTVDYPAAVAAKVLDGVVVAPEPTDASTYFPLGEALAGIR